MNNPYKAPESDIRTSETISKTKWRIFFGVILLLEVISIPILIFDPKESAVDIAIELIIYPIILVGIFGYAYNKRFLIRKFWAFIIPIGILYDTYGLYKLEWGFESTDELYFAIGFTLAIGLPIFYFQYLALYRYCLRSPEIWK